MTQLDNILIYKGDITALECECIVNAANKTLLGGGGVDGAIHKAAGHELLEECRTLNGCNIGEAKITKGYKLKADYVIHTVGPIYSGNSQDATYLASCYKNALNLAKKYKIKSIAFSAISTGVYGYPIKEAVKIAGNTVIKWLNENKNYDIKIIFTCFNDSVYNAYKMFFDEM